MYKYAAFGAVNKEAPAAVFGGRNRLRYNAVFGIRQASQ